VSVRDSLNESVIYRHGEAPDAVIQAAKMVASGEVTIPVAETYRLEEIGAAVAHQARGGKVLLKVGD
jgi:NADPH:quinone reductase-like Zn-dependent oxidoreductase